MAPEIYSTHHNATFPTHNLESIRKCLRYETVFSSKEYAEESRDKRQSIQTSSRRF
jgi:hypothetical protein